MECACGRGASAHRRPHRRPHHHRWPFRRRRYHRHRPHRHTRRSRAPSLRPPLQAASRYRHLPRKARPNAFSCTKTFASPFICGSRRPECTCAALIRAQANAGRSRPSASSCLVVVLPMLYQTPPHPYHHLRRPPTSFSMRGVATPRSKVNAAPLARTILAVAICRAEIGANPISTATVQITNHTQFIKAG